MLLFLTYHKICANASAQDFYSVSRDRFVKHLDALAAAGLAPQPLSPASAATASTTVRSYLSFDDGTQDHCEVVLPLLKQAGLRAVFFVPTAKLDRPGYLTRAQLRELAETGQTVGCHSHEHKRMDTMRPDEVQRQFELSRKILREVIGTEPWIFAPPGGYMDKRVRAIALETGLRVIRTMRWGYNKRLDLTRLETVSPNRFTTEADFRRVLELRDRRFSYVVKEASKRLLPERTYARLRDFVHQFPRGK